MQRLVDAGLSLSDIGRALDRDSGAISQVARNARGAGYGANLVPGLEALEQRLTIAPGQTLTGARAKSAAQLVAEGSSITVPRRRAQGGRRQAAVRQGVKTAGPRNAARPGLYTKGSAHGTGSGLGRVLDAADESGQLVYISVRDADGKRVGLGSRTADEWRELGLDPGSGNLHSQLVAVVAGLIANGELSSDLDDVDGFDVSMIAEA